MKHIEYIPEGVCSRKIDFDIDDNNTVHNIHFLGGCNGNLNAISKILEGYQTQKIIQILKNNKCGMKNTSCADQLARAIEINE